MKENITQNTEDIAKNVALIAQTNLTLAENSKNFIYIVLSFGTVSKVFQVTMADFKSAAMLLTIKL